MKKLLLALFLMGSTASASDYYCQAQTYLKDYKSGFKSVTAAFDYCFDVIKSWNLDTSSGWKDRYCKVSDDGYDKYSVLFVHKDKYYESRYAESIFYALEYDYSEKVYGPYASSYYPKKIEIEFYGSCPSYSSDY